MTIHYMRNIQVLPAYNIVYENKSRGKRKGTEMAGIGEIQMLKSAADRLKGKSDEELIEEIKKLRNVMGDDKEKIRKQIESLKPLRGMLDEQQKSKFDMITKVLLEE